MNIANSGGKLTQMPTPIVPIDGAPQGATASDVDGAGHAGPADASGADARFARVLTQRMAQGGAKEVAGVAPSQLPAASSKASRVDQASRVEQPSKDPKESKAGLPGDAVGNDLAAQFSLASQWAGTPPPPAQGGSAPSTDGAEPLAGTGPAVSDSGGGRASATGAAARGAKHPALPTLDRAAPSAERVVDLTALPPTSRAIAASAAGSNERKAKDEPIARTGSEETKGLQTVLGAVQAATAQPASDPNSLHVLPSLGAAHAVVASPAPPAPPTPPTPELLRQQVVGTPAWSHEVGNAMVRMAVGDLQSASLRLHPEHLGPLDVQVRVDNGVAHLAFQAAHADTRQALEASRPVLEHLFSEQGLKIGDCAVGDSASRSAGFNADGSQANGSSRDHGPGRFASSLVDRVVIPGVGTRVIPMSGMVDTFA